MNFKRMSDVDALALSLFGSLGWGSPYGKNYIRRCLGKSLEHERSSSDWLIQDLVCAALGFKNPASPRRYPQP